MRELEWRYLELPASRRLDIIERLRELLEKEEDIAFAYLHGSFVERKFFRDVDVAVWLRDARRSFYYTVEFPAKIGPSLSIPLDVQVLNGAPLPFKYHVFTQGTLLMSRDEELRERLKDVVIRMYMDLQVLINHPPSEMVKDEAELGRLQERES